MTDYLILSVARRIKLKPPFDTYVYYARSREEPVEDIKDASRFDEEEKKLIYLPSPYEWYEILVGIS